MVKAVEKEDRSIELCKKLLRNSSGLAAYLDTVRLVCTDYYIGRQWAVRRKAGGLLPTVPADAVDGMATAANLTAALVRQWNTRLMVRDWPSRFEPGDNDPDTQIAARQLQSWWNRFYPFAHLTSLFSGQSLSRLIMTSSFAGWYFNERAPGGIDIVPVPGLTLDPVNRIPDLARHQVAVESRAVTVEEAKEMWGDVLDKQGVKLESDAKIADLRPTESYLDSALFGIQPGATESETTGVIIHVLWEDFWRKRTVMIQNTLPTSKRGDGNRRDQEWHTVEEKDWPYGCPYVKSDCFDVPHSAMSRSLVGELMPMQDTLNLGQKSRLKLAVKAAAFKILAVNQGIVNPTALNSNVTGETVWLKNDKMPPAVMQQPKIDSGAETLIVSSVLWMKEMASISEPMQGNAPGRVDTTSGIMRLVEQGSGPIQALADRDYETWGYFFNGAARAAVMRYSRTDPKKFILFVGRTWANLETIKTAAKVLAASPTKCLLKRSEFLAKTRAEIEAEEREARIAGRTTEFQYQWNTYLRTGFPAYEGQDEDRHNVEVMIHDLLDGRMDPQDIRESDNPMLLQWFIERYLKHRVLMDFTEDQVATLEEAKLLCEMWQMQKEQRDSARMMQMASAGKPAPIPGGGGPQELSAAGGGAIGAPAPGAMGQQVPQTA